jgi:glycosyltransferase involved in cell wall biosynthesis
MGSKKLNVAIFISSGIESGGGYQYEYLVLEILKKYHKNSKIDFKYFAANKSIKKDYLGLNIQIKVIRENPIQKIFRYIFSSLIQKINQSALSNHFQLRILKKVNLQYSKFEIEFRSNDIDIVYFLSPDFLTQRLWNIPYIFTLWDLGHLDVLEFPEVSYKGEFERRERLYTKSLKKAYRIIVESNYGKEYAIKKYNLDEKRVSVLKLLPNIKAINGSKHLDIKQKYGIKRDYIFYPAQFWAHKNHVYILKAIKILREEKGISIDVIFSGSNKGNLDYILHKAKEYNIEDLIHYIGFAPNEEIPHLYKQSLALVMPTYLGPTNIPPLEAFAYGVPVCYSDTPFFREQVGDAAFFMDLMNPESLVENLLKIIEATDEVNDKISKGKQVLNSWTEEEFYEKLVGIFHDYKYIRETWGR